MIRALRHWIRLSWRGLQALFHPKPWNDPKRPQWAREAWRQAQPKGRLIVCKEVPTLPILEFLAERPGEWHNWYFGNEKDVHRAMPAGIPDKVLLAKMRRLIARGLVEGCPCGCRGDYEITAKGLLWRDALKLAAPKEGA